MICAELFEIYKLKKTQNFVLKNGNICDTKHIKTSM